MTATRNRRMTLAADTSLNGIDFVEVVDDSQQTLRIHFLDEQPDGAALQAAITEITIDGGDAIAVVEVEPIGAGVWATDRANRPTLEIRTRGSGDFSYYTLRIATTAAVLDPYFATSTFTFKANCPTDLDCKEVSAPPALPAGEQPPIDYRAKDYDSFRRALSEFSALRFPYWQERSEADVGVMLMELLASAADDLSYYQDRVSAEAWLETAEERRSQVRHARLVDYHPAEATAAQVLLSFDVQAGTDEVIPPGLRVSSLAPEGDLIDFETGNGVTDLSNGYPVRSSRNGLPAHWWDDDDRCARQGTTVIHVIDDGSAALVPGMSILVETVPTTVADPPRRQLVYLTAVSAPVRDELYNQSVVRLDIGQPLVADHDLSVTTIRANLVPATQGRTERERFTTTIGWPSPAGVARATVRTGPNGSLQFLHTIGQRQLAWLPSRDTPALDEPQIRLVEISDQARAWHWQSTLLDAGFADEAFTLDAGGFVVTNPDEGLVDYDGAAAPTIRFGDGTFGAVPTDGAVFEATYRVGDGERGNVAAGSIDRIDQLATEAAFVRSVHNPIAATGGRDPEPASQIRDNAPEDFRERQFRAVRSEDYELAAERELTWVERAGTTFRYTGSWLTVFTAVDPLGSLSIDPIDQLALSGLLNRYRMAGYEAFGLAPRYASVDIQIDVCAEADANADVVRSALMQRLDGSLGVDGVRGFFHPDHFTFGVPLRRSSLEAAIQSTPGVDGVTDIRLRRRGHTPGYIEMPDTIRMGIDEVLRVDNDRNRPERGTLQITVDGGR